MTGPFATCLSLLSRSAIAVAVLSAGAYADSKGAAARFHAIDRFSVDKNSIIFVSAGGNCVIRKIATDGRVSTLAGLAADCCYLDGTSTQALFPGCAASHSMPPGTFTRVAPPA